MLRVRQVGGGEPRLEVSGRPHPDTCGTYDQEGEDPGDHGHDDEHGPCQGRCQSRRKADPASAPFSKRGERQRRDRGRERHHGGD
ncbi:MAG: hypothetical protein K0Q84_2803 [Arthrobacter sp.]|nr:hypothetical protein [Arthrobacter sp.]